MNKTLLHQIAYLTIRELIKDFPNLEIFLGGSLRFGYHTHNSDIDLFAYISETKYVNFHDVICGLKYNFQYQNLFSDLIKYTDNSNLFIGFNKKIHLNILTDYPAYIVLVNNHIRIETFLYHNPALTTYIKELKQNTAVNGKEIYKILISILPEKEEKI